MIAPKHPHVPFRPPPLARGSGQVVTPDPAPVPMTIPAQPGLARCREKGCIFPVNTPGEGTCVLHRLAEKEPKLFLSLQPSSFLLDQAKFVVPHRDFDYSRARDRRRLAVLRERTLEDVA